MVTGRRRGRARPGCLVTIVLLGIVAYAAISVGTVYMRAYRFRDAMAQESRFAERTTNAEIINRLRAKADSLGLPDDAQRVRVQRSRRAISIWAEYADTVDLHVVKREVRFSPHIEREW
jgi:hypothetical protein